MKLPVLKRSQIISIPCLILLFLLSAAIVKAQQLGEFSPKDNTTGLNKLKSKKIYIANFTVNYQVFNEKEDINKGGALIGNKGVRGDAKAALTVGLGNISQNDFQQLTNDL